MNQLTQSPVRFDAAEHRYFTPDGRELSGITAILSRYLFADKYDGIDPAVLRRAAARGTAVHQEIQMLCEGFAPSEPSAECRAFLSLGLSVAASEYLVSDNENVASCIDLVTDDLDLCDIKTTATLDREYLSWQLSIYACLFEKQNPALKVGRLYGIHLRGDSADMVEVPRIGSCHIRALMDAYTAGAPTFANPLKAIATAEDAALMSRVTEVETWIVELEAELKRYKEMQTAYKDELLRLMDGRGVVKLDTGLLAITRKADSERTTLDTKALRADHPDIYDRYARTQTVKGDVIVRIKEY